MRIPTFLAVTLAFFCAPFLQAYEITGAKPISKLEEQQKRAVTQKKLVTIVFRGSDHQCPRCAVTAANGLQAVQNSSVVLVIEQKEAHDKAVMDKLPEVVRKALQAKMSGGAWVAFYVFDPALTKEVAYGDRSTLESDKKKISEFAKSVREARKAVM